MADVTIKTIYAIENNKGNPTIDVLKRVLNVLGLEIKVQIKTVEE
jgi:transcriptional regulator with XRE-family HTH domain